MSNHSVTEVVAQELGLREFTQEHPNATIHGVTNVAIQGAGENYRVYLAKDSNEDTSDLEEGARLSAFYNSQFILRFFATSKLDVPVGEHKISFQIADEQDNHSVFVLKVPSEAHPKHNLTMEDLLVIAENIAKLHATTANHLQPSLYQIINKNYENIGLHEKRLERQLVDILTQAVNGEHFSLFSRPHDVIEMVDYLSSRNHNVEEDHSEENRDEEGSHKKPAYDEVICHGNLTSSTCLFKGNDLAEIADWDNVHFGDPTEDLARLIISSADTEIRRNHFMKIFRQYYYTLIDRRVPKFRLSHLKDLYRRNQKKAVLAGIENLLNTLSSDASEQEKRKEVHRWEAALFDVYMFENGDYISDDEQCLFEK